MRGLGYLTLVPILGALFFIEIYPLAFSSYLSVTTVNGEFAGTANYLQMINDHTFWNSLAISLAYSSGSTLVALAIALLLVYLLSQRFRGKGVFEALFIVPLAIPPIVAGILWSPSALWDDVNTFIHFALGLQYVDVLSPFFFFPAMLVSEAWEWSPLLMLVALSLLGSVRREVFEAAAVHGASSWQVFRNIALPTIMRSPVMQFVLVLRFVDAMRAFEIPYAWSNWVGYPQVVGSPVDTLSLYLYKLMFVPGYNFPAPYISAVAITMLTVTLITALALFRFMSTLGGVK